MNEETQPTSLSVFVCDSISVSEWIVVDLIIERITTWEMNPKKGETLVSVADYRQLLGDYTSTDKRIVERLQFLEAFCRNIIKPNLQKIYEQGKKNIIR